MTEAEIQQKLDQVRIAEKVLCFLYPGAGHDQPKSAGVVLRRLQQREEDLIGFLHLAQDAQSKEV